VLKYLNFRNFEPVIQKAKEACIKSGYAVADHFAEMRNMVSIGSGAQRPIEDWKLSRYACYLVIQNADPSKPLVALGQTYFAVQTRRQEMAVRSLKERGCVVLDQPQHSGRRGAWRFSNTPPVVTLLRLVSDAAALRPLATHRHLWSHPGVVQPLDYAIFMDHGYRGLYGGLGMRDICERKRLKPKQQVLDHMGSTELAANLFRATQTEEKLRRENVRNKDHANRIHNEVGRKVRKTIHELGGTMPENLPVAESIKKVESREKKRLKAGQTLARK
jgi:DNA-damage-inducible protein D